MTQIRDEYADVLKQIVIVQAQDPGLWAHCETAMEAYLQSALRKLSEAVEQALEIENGQY